MMNQFNKISQAALLAGNMSVVVQGRLQSKKLRVEILNNIKTSQNLIKEDPENLWRVYSLCKQVYELAELDRVDFNGASYIEKLNLIRQIAPFADPEALSEGVAEYHESRVRENWKMRFLEVSDDRESIQRTVGTDC
jgi:hypothetical protein